MSQVLYEHLGIDIVRLDIVSIDLSFGGEVCDLFLYTSNALATLGGLKVDRALELQGINSAHFFRPLEIIFWKRSLSFCNLIFF